MTSSIIWRPLLASDLHVVEAIAARVHPDFPEDAEVFAERQRLYAEGTLLLEVDGEPSGYVLSHPWMFGQLPELNALLGNIPDKADTFYIHDLALLPAARGTGAAAMIVGLLLNHARARLLPTVSLVAVNGSQAFWYKHGFRVAERPELAGKLGSYDAAARLMVRRLV